MERRIAENLVDELGRHTGIITPDRELFLGALLPVYFEEQGRSFHFELPEREQLVQEPNRYHHLSVRRLLRNGNARGYQLSPMKKAYEAMCSKLGFYSSDALTRSIRADPELVEMMGSSSQPFSLLGKMKTYDYDNPDDTLFIVTRPVLVIPGADNEKVTIWEDQNATYEKEVGLFLKWNKRISRAEYQEAI